MLLDEDPATLIHHTIGNFNILPDKLAVSRINDSLSTLQQARDLRVRQGESALKKLSRQLTTLSNHHSETISSHSSTSHASEIATLDTNKFRIAKSASDLEIESERLYSQVADLQAKLHELDNQGVEGGQSLAQGPAAAQKSVLENEVLLKLWVYRSLGISVDRDEKGEYTKVTVGDAGRGDLRVINLDPKFSSYFYANFFWNLI